MMEIAWFGAGMVSGALLVVGSLLVLWSGTSSLEERIDAACTLIESSAFATSEAYKLGVSEGMADGWQQAMDSIHGGEEAG